MLIPLPNFPRSGTAAALLLIMVGLVSCSESGKPDAAQKQDSVFEQLSFDVDSSRLGDRLELAGIEFHVPRDWTPADATVLSAIRSVAGKDTSRHRIFPEFVHAHASGAMLVVSRFPQVSDETVEFSSWAIEVGEAYRSARAGMELKESWLSLGGVEALQLYSGNSRTIHFKLLLNGREPVSADYTVPASEWERQVHFVESSLGSIRRISSSDNEP